MTFYSAAPTRSVRAFTHRIRVTAMCWDGHNFDALQAWVGIVKRANGTVFLWETSTWVPLTVGDWVVLDDEHRWRRVPAGRFTAEYAPA